MLVDILYRLGMVFFSKTNSVLQKKKKKISQRCLSNVYAHTKALVITKVYFEQIA